MAPVLYTAEISPPVRAVLMAAKMINLELEHKQVDLMNMETRTEEFKKVNPQHTIPTLDDDGFILWDSHAIMTYLVQTYAEGSSLYPAEPRQRAVVDQRLHFDSGILFPRLKNVFFPILFLGNKEIPEDKRLAVIEAYEFLEAFLQDNDWMVGQEVTLADLSIVASISSLDIVIPVEEEAFPKLFAWMERCRGLECYEANIAGLEVARERLTQ